MKFDKIHAIVGGVPYITPDNARTLYDKILSEELDQILELGIAHGTATCYMAAALHELGRGSIVSVDLLGAKENFSPSAEEQLQQAGLSQFSRIVRTETGYNWFLHDEISQNTHEDHCREVYNLCVIDGPKNWTIDGAAFFLVDKLLKKDGWIIFDDFHWTYSSVSDRREVTDGISHRSLSAEEQDIPHIREIFNLLVKQHPHYGNLLVLDEHDWAMAQKTMSPEKTYTVSYNETTTDILAKGIRKLQKLVKRQA